MLFSKEYVGYLARQVTRKLIAAEMIATDSVPGVTEKIHGALLDELTLEEYQSFSPHFDNDLYACLDHATAVARRQERGGTAPAAVRKALARFRKRIGE